MLLVCSRGVSTSELILRKYKMARLFSTQFPLDAKASLEGLLELGKKWIIGSQHNTLEKDEVMLMEKHGDKCEKEGQRAELGRASASDYEVLGFRYCTPGKDNSTYTADIVFLSQGDSRLASVILDYDTGVAGAQIPSGNKPYIIKMLIEEIGGGLDGDILVGNKPIHLKDGDEAFVSEILRGNTPAIMPVVYLSRDNYNLLKINADLLADKLSGVANILVEPSRKFSFALRDHSRGYNVFGGAVGIYWPEGFGKYFWLPEHEEIKGDNAISAVCQKVIDGLKSRKLRREITWENLQSLHNQFLIQKIKESHTTESTELSCVYDEVLREKDEQIKSSDGRIKFLENELRKMSANRDSEGGLITSPQVEQVYEDELKGLVIDALRTAVINTPDNTRRHSLLEAIVDSNAQSSNARGEIVKKIKIMFNDFTGLTGPMRNELQRIGFEIIKDGPHYKMYLEGQKGGICVSIPGTPGDRRAGKNLASDIVRTFF